MEKSPTILKEVKVKPKFKRSSVKITRPKIDYEEQIRAFRARQERAKLKPKETTFEQ